MAVMLLIINWTLEVHMWPYIGQHTTFIFFHNWLSWLSVVIWVNGNLVFKFNFHTYIYYFYLFSITGYHGYLSKWWYL